MTTKVSSAVFGPISNLIEKATITAAAPAATTALNWIDTPVVWYTTNTANAFTVNIRGNASTTLNSRLAINEAASMVLMVNCANATHFAASTIQIDGVTTNVTTRWQGGSAPTSGNSGSIDAYIFTVIKTAATPAYTVLASQARFG